MGRYEEFQGHARNAFVEYEHAMRMWLKVRPGITVNEVFDAYSDEWSRIRLTENAPHPITVQIRSDLERTFFTRPASDFIALCLSVAANALKHVARPGAINHMRELFRRKNADYGNAFLYEGIQGLFVRIGDKISRAKSLLLKGYAQVIDESLDDTLIDLANYALLLAVYVRLASCDQTSQPS